MLSYILKKIYCAIYVSWFPLKQIKGASAMERSPNCRLTSDLLLLSQISLRNFSALSHFLLKAIYIFRNKERKTCVFSFLCVLQRPQAASVPRNPIPCSRGDLSLSRLLSLSLSLSHWLSITLYWPCENTLTIPQSKPFVHATPYTSDPVPVRDRLNSRLSGGCLCAKFRHFQQDKRDFQTSEQLAARSNLTICGEDAAEMRNYLLQWFSPIPLN